MKDILAAITEYRLERGWTEYQLAERSGLPQSTISSWYRKNMVPTVPSLGENLFCLWNYAVSIILRGRFPGIFDRLTEEASGELVEAK